MDSGNDEWGKEGNSDPGERCVDRWMDEKEVKKGIEKDWEKLMDGEMARDGERDRWKGGKGS